MIDEDEVRRARKALGEMLEQIDGGDAMATAAQRAKLAGAVAALDGLIDVSSDAGEDSAQ